MTSTAFEKLEYFIRLHGYTIQTIFHDSNQGRILHCLSTETGDPLLIRIPSTYSILISLSDSRTSRLYRVTVDTEEIDGVEHYTPITEQQLQSWYTNVDVQVDLPGRHPQSMSSHLNDQYKHHVVLDNLESDRTVCLHGMARQLRRFKYCTQGVPYRVSLVSDRYLGYWTVQDELEWYELRDMKPATLQRMYLILDLPMFYDKVEHVQHESQQLYKAIYQILETNQNTHCRNMKRILDRHQNIMVQSSRFIDLKHQYQKYVNDYTELLSDLKQVEQHHQEERHELKEQTSGSLQSDLKRTHQLQTLDKKQSQVTQTKRKCMETLNELKSHYDHLTLRIDAILFDNIIMVDRILHNMDQLQQLDQLDPHHSI
jgi:Skp family chaperone for outer membrane proteins